MRAIIESLNSFQNVELVTFDVGHKPHPTTVAFFKDKDGKTRLIRGTVDFKSNYEMDHQSIAQQIQDCVEFSKIEEPPLKDSFVESTPEHPFCITFDGRLPENQDIDTDVPSTRKPPSKSGFSTSL